MEDEQEEDKISERRGTKTREGGEGEDSKDVEEEEDKICEKREKYGKEERKGGRRFEDVMEEEEEDKISERRGTETGRRQGREKIQ